MTDSTDDPLAKAQAAIAQMRDDYPTWAEKDIADLSNHIHEIQAGTPNAGTAHPAYRKAHDIRGQGGSFGYPLLTEIADSLCHCLKVVKTWDEEGIKILQAHANAMHVIISNRISGDGGDMGPQIVAGLKNAASSYLNEAPD